MLQPISSAAGSCGRPSPVQTKERPFDILILQKDADGSVEAVELDDLDSLDELRALETELADILAVEDVEHLAAAMEPGTIAGAIVWENRGQHRSVPPPGDPAVSS